jgi:alkylated DNA repair dioxygenase AlkB
MQRPLFESGSTLPDGFLYESDFINPQEERDLVEEMRVLPLTEARYRGFTAKRRIVSYGGSYDFSSRELLPAHPIPPFLYPLRERIAAWANVSASEFGHALIAQYQIGTQLGWHRDVPEFELVAGVSLVGSCRMRLRPYPPKGGRDPKTLSIDLEPRSIYVMRGEARWGWQHSIPPTKELRYSITFRTRNLKRSSPDSGYGRGQRRRGESESSLRLQEKYPD